MEIDVVAERAQEFVAMIRSHAERQGVTPDAAGKLYTPATITGRHRKE